MIISDAVRISMSKPILFHPHKFYIKDKNGKRIIDPEKKDYLYIDGSVLNNNYLITMFDSNIKNDNIL